MLFGVVFIKLSYKNEKFSFGLFSSRVFFEFYAMKTKVNKFCRI